MASVLSPALPRRLLLPGAHCAGKGLAASNRGLRGETRAPWLEP